MNRVGGFFVSAAMVWICLLRVNKLRGKPRLLQDLADAFTIVERVSCVQLFPLPEAFRSAAEVQGMTADFFRMLYLGMKTNAPFSELWSRAAETVPLLDIQERQTLLSLRTVLGSNDVEMQRDGLQRFTAYLRKRAEKAQCAASSGAKLTIGLGTIGCLMFLILFC